MKSAFAATFAFGFFVAGCQRAAGDAAVTIAANEAPVSVTRASSALVTAGGTPIRTAASSASERERQVTSLLETVLAHRHWPAVPTPRIIESSPAELRQLLSREVAEQLPRKAALAQDRSLALLGLIPSGYDTTSSFLDSFSHSVVGVYLTSQRIVALRIGRAPNAMADTLVHELAHVAQDSLFGLGSRLTFSAVHADRIAGLHALAEGEATRIQVELGPLGGSGFGASDHEIVGQLRSSMDAIDAPTIVRRSAIAPYIDGYRFVAYLRSIGDWQLVDRVWERGISNTAEILHPERWVAASGPLRPLDDPKQPSQELRHVVVGNSEVELQTSWGEEGLRIFLEETLAEPEAARLASGWIRDTLWLFGDEDRQNLAWHIRLRSSEQARRLGSALSQGLFGKYEVEPGCRRLEHRTVALRVNRQDIVVTARGDSDTLGATPKASSCRSQLQWSSAIIRSL